MDVAILGCGPAGLLAAHAATMHGANVQIFSRRQESKIGGAQYLHRHIPRITDPAPEERLSYVKIGTREGYAMKVYGDRFANTSWDAFQGDQYAWSMQAAYERLRSLYWDQVIDQTVVPETVENYCDEFDFVFSTVPAKALCTDQKYDRPLHTFASQPIALVPTKRLMINNLILYSGRQTEPWYRVSRIFGEEWTELALNSASEAPGVEGELLGFKPLHTDCDCHLMRSNFRRVGRFGKWQKAELVSDAFFDVDRALTRVKRPLGLNPGSMP